MKRLLIGVVVLLGTQFCTSELNEIDGVVGDHIDSNNGGGNISTIPSDKFLGQYFSSRSGDNPISQRIENRITHDFNSPLSNDFNKSELSAKWTGNFYFESGNYAFTINSDKNILFKIDNKVVLSDDGNSEDNTHTFEEQLDGVHQIEVEYNLENESTTDPVDNTTATEPVDNTSTEPVDNTTPITPVDNTTPLEPVDIVLPTDPVDNTSPSVPVDNNLIVNAKGSNITGVNAHFKVLVDGQEIGDAHTSSTYAPYDFLLPKDPKDVGEIHIVYDNDTQTRDLYVESIELDGKFILATAENLTYKRTNGVLREYTGKMAWNGSLIFNITETTDNATPADPVDNTTPVDPVDNTTPADPVETTAPADPVVEVDNGTPTVEVDWEPIQGNTATFFEGFENGLHINPPWHQIGQGTVETVSSPVLSGSSAVRMYLETRKYSSNTHAKAQIEYNPAWGTDVPRYGEWFTSVGHRFAFYVPANYKNDPVTEAIFSLHQSAASPYWKGKGVIPFYMVVDGNSTIRVQIEYAPEQDISTAGSRNFSNLLTLKPGHWHFFIIDTHWDYRENGNGYHKVYAKIDSPPAKSDLVVDYNGPTGVNDTRTGYPLWNIYKYGWKDQDKVNQSLAAGVTYREYFFDNIEISNSPYFGK